MQPTFIGFNPGEKSGGLVSKLRYVTWTRLPFPVGNVVMVKSFVQTESTISCPWPSFDVRPFPDFSPRRWDQICEWSCDYARINTAICSVGYWNSSFKISENKTIGAIFLWLFLILGMFQLLIFDLQHV